LELALSEATLNMREHEVGYVPVVKADGKVVGLVAVTDPVRAAHPAQPSRQGEPPCS